MERASSNLTHNIKNIWLSCFPNKARSIESFFKNYYKMEDTIIKLEDNMVVSFLTRIKYDFMLNGRILRTSSIANVLSMPKYRDRGYEEDMLKVVCDILDHSELISFASATNIDKELLEKFGFEVIYKKNRYTLTRENIQRITNDGCTFDPSPLDMIQVYSFFLKRFNGYKVKSIQEFEKYKRSVYDRGGKIVAYYEDNKIRGYASLIIENKHIEIEECIYTDTISLFKLLNVALQQRHTVYLNVSEFENLVPLFSGLIPEVIDFKMARLNNRELFNRLFNYNITNIQEAFYISDKPVYQSEEY